MIQMSVLLHFCQFTCLPVLLSSMLFSKISTDVFIYYYDHHSLESIIFPLFTSWMTRINHFLFVFLLFIFLLSLEFSSFYFRLQRPEKKKFFYENEFLKTHWWVGGWTAFIRHIKISLLFQCPYYQAHLLLLCCRALVDADCEGPILSWGKILFCARSSPLEASWFSCRIVSRPKFGKYINQAQKHLHNLRFRTQPSRN